MKNKKIDILMGIYNCEKYLIDSIESLLNQSFGEWRLIMCDDGSTDNSYIIAREYANKYKDRILLLKNKQNMGLNYTLNKCLNNATAKYIARMDGDDLCHPERLRKEYEFLEKNTEYSFVSTNVILFDENGEWGCVINPKSPIKYDFLKGSPFCHAAVLIKREAMLDVNGYTISDKLLRVEDYHLWFKLYEKGYIGYNLQEKLYLMRDDQNAIKRRTWKNRKNEYYVRKIGYKMLKIPFYLRVYQFRPIILGIIPQKLYRFLHRVRLKKGGKYEKN